MIRNASLSMLAMLLLASLLGTPTQAFHIGGELKTALAYEWEDAEFGRAQTQFLVELQPDLGWDRQAHLSFSGSYDALENAGDISLDQAYLSIFFPDTDLTVGRQVLNWGTADGFNPTNNINPMQADSLTEGTLQGEPLLAVQATYYGADWFFTGVVVPVFTPLTIDHQMRRLFGDDAAASALLGAIADVDQPPRALENMEYALRAETLLAGWDMQLSYYFGFSDLPAMTLVTSIDPVTMQPIGQDFVGYYRREHKLGVATAGSVGDIGVWGEMAYSWPDELAEQSSDPLEVIHLLSINEPYLQAVVGADYTLDVGKGLYVQGQYIYQQDGSLLSPYHDPGEEPEPGTYLMGRIAYEFNHNNGLEVVGLINTSDENGMIIPQYTHRFAQSAEWQLGAILHYGDGEFERIPRQITTAVTIRF